MKVKEGAGWPPPVPGEPQEHLGRGVVYTITKKKFATLGGGLSDLKRGVHTADYVKKIKNTHLANINSCIFIYHPSYILISPHTVYPV
jgi:hypothetical protein